MLTSKEFISEYKKRFADAAFDSYRITPRGFGLIYFFTTDEEWKTEMQSKGFTVEIKDGKYFATREGRTRLCGTKETRKIGPSEAWVDDKIKW